MGRDGVELSRVDELSSDNVQGEAVWYAGD